MDDEPGEAGESGPFKQLSVQPAPPEAAVLRALLGRRSLSPRRLAPPGPDAEELRVMAAAAARAPDHGGLRPWRFRQIEGAARLALGDLCAAALAAEDPQAGEAQLQREREKIAAGPCLVAVFADLQADRAEIPVTEQHASIGAAILGFLLAAEALGYAGMMLSGHRVRRPALRAALGLAPGQHLIGFIALGRPAAPPAARPAAEMAAFETLRDPGSLAGILGDAPPQQPAQGEHTAPPEPEGWLAVDGFLAGRLLPADPLLDAALAANAAAGLPPHDVSPLQGGFLQLMARIAGARRILEIGTLGGYSTIWLARALPADGRLITLEADPRHAAIATANIARAGLAGRVDLRPGAALDSLPAIEAEGLAPFDLVFIDADKPDNPAYLDWALRLSRPGTVILADNVVRGGAILDPGSSDPRVQGVRRFLQMIAAEPRLQASALQTVGAKGWDGFVLAVVQH